MAGIGHNSPPPDAGPYAIYRTAKIKTLANLAGSANHMTRASDTPNADPSRAHLNRVIVGSDDPEADVLALLPEVGQRDPDTGKMLRRKNSVLAIELLLTVSPEWWRDATDQQKADWEKQTVDWVAETYGVENVAHLRMHGDELTPHMTGYVVPIDPDTGGLNCRRWLGERQLLRDQQTSYAAAVEDLGIQRGVAGSKAIHEAVKRAYGDLSAPEAQIVLPAPPHLAVSPEAWREAVQKQMLEDLAPTQARANNANVSRNTAKAAKAQAAADRRRTENATAKLDQAKETASKMRSLPLFDVLAELGFKQDKHDPLKWRNGDSVISPGNPKKPSEASKWYDHTASKGRGGAIDLVSHVMGTDYKASLAWLAGRFGSDATAADYTAHLQRKATIAVKSAIKEHPAFTPPPAVADNWHHVRRHLVEERCLPANYIDKLHDKGDLYADDKKNAVFVCRDDAGKATGAELKGTYVRPDGSKFSGMSPGSEKDRGGFSIGKIAKATAIYLVESAIDAISLAKLLALDGKKKFAIISTAGTTPEPRKWFPAIPAEVRRFCGFDNDKAGDDAAKKLRRNKFERLRPAGIDWNDDLKERLGSSQSSSSTTAANDSFQPSSDTGYDPNMNPDMW